MLLNPLAIVSILVILQSLLFVGLASIHEEATGWCESGSTTATTGECICSTHRGFFCAGDACQTGFGMSFFHKDCVSCKCVMSSEWKERKKALKQQMRKEQNINGD